MGIFSLLRRDDQVARTTREALREARSAGGTAGTGGAGRGGAGRGGADRGGALLRLVESFRDVGLDGRLTYSSAARVARRAQRGRGRRRPQVAIRRVVRRHRRGVTAAGFLTGLGGIITLPVLLPTNVFEFYVQSTRMVGAIAAVRGYDLDDEEVRARVLVALMGEESADVLGSVGLGPVAGTAGRQVAKRLPQTVESQIAGALGGRILRRFGLRSVRLFGKAIPGLAGVLGAITDRRQLTKIAAAADSTFPPR